MARRSSTDSMHMVGVEGAWTDLDHVDSVDNLLGVAKIGALSPLSNSTILL